MRRPDRGGQVQPGGRRAADLGAGDDPVRLGVALEAVGQAEPLPGQPVQHPLAEVPERRVAEVVRERGRLHHVRVAAAELVQQVAVAGRRRSSRSAIARATWATLRLWVSRLCTSSPEPPGLITWVTPPSRAKNGEPTIRSRSARNGLAGEVAERPGAAAEEPPGARIRRCSMIATLAQRRGVAGDAVQGRRWGGSPGRGRRRPSVRAGTMQGGTHTEGGSRS